MKLSLQALKPWMMPFAMALGAVFHNYIGRLETTVPYLIFAMLLIAFCRVKPSQLKLSRMSLWLLAIQILGAVAIYFALRNASRELAEGLFICVICPTATAAPVVTGMLGGSVPRLASFSLISNIAAAITAPVFFAYFGAHNELSFFDGFISIAAKVGPLILLPMLLAFLLYFMAPRVHSAIARRQSLSFYIWALSLVISVGTSVSYIMSEPSNLIPLLILLALGAAVACAFQFFIGHKIGEKYGDKICGTQALGQKNTILAIWMALTYMTPVCSVAPAAYIIWQNSLNSFQLYRKMKTDNRALHSSQSQNHLS